MPSSSLPPSAPPSAPPSGPTALAGRLLLAAGLAALLVGCGQDTEVSDVGESPTQGQVVRTPSPLTTDVPSTDPPLVEDLPGPSGGAPGSPPTTVPEASPGESTDGGGGPGN